MQSENRICKNCQSKFEITPDDFGFYEKMRVPPPTWCHDCKLQRRMLWRNERNLNKRKCDLCSKDIISLYHADVAFPVYCNPCWYSDGWDDMATGRKYDFTRPFFTQFQELLRVAPRPALIGMNNVNSPYINYSVNLKNCYLGLCCSDCEDCGYIYRTFTTKNSYDCFTLVDSELCVELTQSARCFKTGFSKFTENAVESLFLNDCKNVSNSIGSSGLRNQQYMLFNETGTAEEYEKMRAECGSYAKLQEFQAKAYEVSLTVPRKASRILQATNSSGEDLTNVKNCSNCFVIREGENLNYAYFGSNLKDGRDFNFADNSELLYDSSNIEQNYMELFSLTSWFSHFVTYCDHAFSSQNLFACVGVRNKQYCVLNKQYTKEEYEALIAKIVAHMKTMPYVDAKGRTFTYGEFFPPDLSPFAYNETIAQEYFPLLKDEALERGYRWRDPEEKTYQVTKKPEEIPDTISEIDESILKEVIGCSHEGTCKEQCTTAFRITAAELDFYRRMNLPLPRYCPNCRHYARLKQRNPLKLWHRNCAKCSKDIETSYAPDRPEIIYCEQCYQQEVI